MLSGLYGAPAIRLRIQPCTGCMWTHRGASWTHRAAQIADDSTDQPRPPTKSSPKPTSERLQTRATSHVSTALAFDRGGLTRLIEQWNLAVNRVPTSSRVSGHSNESEAPAWLSRLVAPRSGARRRALRRQQGCTAGSVDRSCGSARPARS
jgi:hypothetical protein